MKVATLALIGLIDHWHAGKVHDEFVSREDWDLCVSQQEHNLQKAVAMFAAKPMDSVSWIAIDERVVKI